MAGGSVFITGAGGFLGRAVVEKLSAQGDCRILALVRRTARPAAVSVSYVQGDILDPKSYAESLKNCDTVLHLAALTGKHAPDEYFKVNRDGTKVLLAEAARSGVRRFIFVSTIAAKFKNQQYYHYAQSKLQAEGLVKTSSLKWTIVRPTMILGKESAVLGGLSKLATLPIIPIFGDGRIRVQPVDVEDLAVILAAMLDDENLEARTVEIGGPEVVSMESLMQSVRQSKAGTKGKVVHLPVGPIAACLGIMEPLLRPVLPITAGQMASFRNEGTVEPDSWVAQRQANMKTIEEMLRAAA
jgi:NADH dehydrogenase